jgi:hypothetical protein
MKQKKAKQKTTKNHIKAIPVGVVNTELVFHAFDASKDDIRHSVKQIALAIQLRFNLEHFGPSAFGLNEEEME